MHKRPLFQTITSYEEFKKYYWYLADLKMICKDYGIDHIGNKIELNQRIEQYFAGTIVKKQPRTSPKNINHELRLDMKLLENGFAMRSEYRTFFGEHLGVKNFHFTADMAAALKKVRAEKNKDFTVQDLMDIYTGKSNYARYDTSSCQWNKFVKGFCSDPANANLKDKLKKAATLWSIVRDSDMEKVYHPELMKFMKSVENEEEIR